MDGLAFHDDESGSATRPLLVVRRVLLGRHPVERAERGVVRLKHDAVAQLDAGEAPGPMASIPGIEPCQTSTPQAATASTMSRPRMRLRWGASGSVATLLIARSGDYGRL